MIMIKQMQQNDCQRLVCYCLSLYNISITYNIWQGITAGALSELMRATKDCSKDLYSGLRGIVALCDLSPKKLDL